MKKLLFYILKGIMAVSILYGILTFKGNFVLGFLQYGALYWMGSIMLHLFHLHDPEIEKDPVKESFYINKFYFNVFNLISFVTIFLIVYNMGYIVLGGILALTLVYVFGQIDIYKYVNRPETL